MHLGPCLAKHCVVCSDGEIADQMQDVAAAHGVSRDLAWPRVTKQGGTMHVRQARGPGQGQGAGSGARGAG